MPPVSVWRDAPTSLDRSRKKGNKNNHQRSGRKKLQEDSSSDDDDSQGEHDPQLEEEEEGHRRHKQRQRHTMSDIQSQGENKRRRTMAVSPTNYDNDEESSSEEEEEYEGPSVNHMMVVESYVKRQLFRYVKFINSDAMLAVGGPLCIKVMKELNYHSNGFHNVWLAIRDGIKNTITMKRNNVSGEMKKEFISK